MIRILGTSGGHGSGICFTAKLNVFLFSLVFFRVLFK